MLKSVLLIGAFLVSLSSGLNVKRFQARALRSSRVGYNYDNENIPQWLDLFSLEAQSAVPRPIVAGTISTNEALGGSNNDAETDSLRSSIGAWKTLIPANDVESETLPTLRAYLFGTIELQESHKLKVADLWDGIKKKGSMREMKGIDSKRIIDALTIAYVALYGKQTQRSLEDSIARARGTAAVLGELKADVTVILSGILHDIISDIDRDDMKMVLEHLKPRFGSDVLSLVDCYMKLPKLMAKTAVYTPLQAENHIQMMITSAEDYRVLYIRLAERLHTMRVLRSLPLNEAEMKKIAQESLHVYAPLAHKMGVMKVKGELEDLAFRVLDPEMFTQCRQTQIAAHKAFQEATEQIQEMLLKDPFMKQHGASYRLTYRVKDKYQLYLKMTRKNLSSVNDVRDALGLRVIIENPNKPGESDDAREIRDHEICYHIVEQLRSMKGWQPSTDGFKDYIAGAKENGYQSLHQYIKNIALGTNVEVQVRTRHMHVKAELGGAAHWFYKDEIYRPEVASHKYYRLAWRSPKQLSAKSPAELIGMAKQQVLNSRVLVFLDDRSTVLNLRKGSTALDAAFAIHSDIGLSAMCVRVQGRRIGLIHPLQNGDVITVERNPVKGITAIPSWLNLVNSPHSLSHLRKYFKENHRETTTSLGLAQLLTAIELNKEKIKERFGGTMPSTQTIFKMASYNSGLNNIGEVLLALGTSTASAAKKLIGRLFEIPSDSIETMSMSRALSWARMQSKNAWADSEYLKDQVLIPAITEALPALGFEDIEASWTSCIGPIPQKPWSARTWGSKSSPKVGNYHSIVSPMVKSSSNPGNYYPRAPYSLEASTLGLWNLRKAKRFYAEDALAREQSELVAEKERTKNVVSVKNVQDVQNVKTVVKV